MYRHTESTKKETEVMKLCGCHKIFSVVNKTNEHGNGQ